MGFREDIISGRFGEYAVSEALNKLPTVKQVVDVREDKIFQAYDVDFLVQNTNLQYTWLEVKTDYRTFTTGNMVYEYTTSGNIGACEHTKAQYIAYYIPQNGNIYLMDVKKLRKHVSRGYEEKQISSNTRGYLVPISELERDGVIIKMLQGEPQGDFVRSRENGRVY